MSPPIKEDADPSATSFVHSETSGLKEASVMFQSAVDGDVSVSFSHVHLYVDRVDAMSVYKEFEQKLNMLSRRISPCSESADVESSRLVWESINPTRFGGSKTGSFETENRDVVKQLLAGFGFRVTGTRMREDSASAKVNTRSVLVTSRDPRGVQFVVTALDDCISPVTIENGVTNVDTDEFFHFDASHLHQFFEAHDQRQGVAVLAFEATPGSLETIYQRYKEMHPKLLLPTPIFQYEGGTKVLEVFAFYLGEKCQSEPDVGTKLRFIESSSSSSASTRASCVLPGLQHINAEFDDSSQPAYCDHWVSNVVSRTGFLDTLEDTLGFTPKVDFNAGVVAAGEAQIESTVTGNDPRFVSSDKESALKDQSQVYLPINNALSSVGHVGGFLREIGQGVQHIASRVDDLISFIQRCNDYRKMTGEGFTFLNIPRSYYGVLTEKQLVHGISSSTHPSDDTREEELNGSTAQGISESCASSILIALEKSGVISSEGAVDLDLDASDIDDALEKHLIMDPSSSSDHVEEYRNKKQEVIDIILRSRYTNLYSLLRHHLSAESYLGIVKNQILVDVQGEDLLYQIFTCPILQRLSGEEAPFLEFIQRVCSECKDPNGCPAKMKPGCGGFGIRNFLTLFLSIEVSKAMLDVSRARSLLVVSSTDDGDKNQQSRTRRELQFAKEMVQLFTNQLNESNPILTELSDAMTQEGVARAALLEITTTVMTSDDDTDYMTTAAAARRQMWESHLKNAQDAKAMGHEKLMLCSSKYKNLMKELREQHDDDNMKHEAVGSRLPQVG
mmetsp:Transcript_10558/g.19234  ORF Transcript_10558/g.19234 Transcript_10558/m.19234 type:complete len:789 (-) Transcript_10558:209-2575(-)